MIVLFTLMIGCLFPPIYLLGGAVLLFVLCFFLWLFCRKRGRLCRAAFLFTAAVLLFLAGYQSFVRAPAEALAEQTVRVTAVVESGSRTDYGYVCLLRINDIHTPQGETVAVPPFLHITGYYSGERLPTGSRISTTLTPHKSVEAGFSYTAAFHAFLNGSLNEIETLSGGSGFSLLRERIQTVFSEKLSTGAEQLMNSMLLGERSGLPDEVTRAFRRTGLLHLLALSGLHLSLVTALVAGICRMLPLPRKAQLALTATASFLFLVMTGAQVSMRRAIVMMLFGTAAAFCRRRADGRESLGFAVILLCLTQPYLVWHAGFLCSVSVTYGILRFSPPMTRYLLSVFRFRKKWLRALTRAGCVSVSAWLASLPVAAAAFDEISLIGPIVSLVFIPLFSLTMTFGFLTACFGFLPQDLVGVLCGRVCSFCGDASLRLLDLLDRFPKLTVKMSSVGVRLTLLTALLWIALTFLVRIPRRRLYAGVGAAVLLAAGFLTAPSRQGKTTVTVFSRSDEKYVAVETADTLFLLIAGTPDSIGWDAAEWLAAKEDDVELLCLLTPEQGLPPVANQARYLLLPDTALDADGYEVTWTSGGCVLTLPQGRICLGEPPAERKEHDLQIYLRKIPVTAGQERVRCDIMKGTCGMATTNGKPAVFTLED